MYVLRALHCTVSDRSKLLKKLRLTGRVDQRSLAEFTKMEPPKKRLKVSRSTSQWVEHTSGARKFYRRKGATVRPLSLLVMPDSSQAMTSPLPRSPLTRDAAAVRRKRGITLGGSRSIGTPCRQSRFGCGTPAARVSSTENEASC